MSKTKKSAVPREHDHKAMILDPHRWPSWPCLPLKRKNNSLEDKNLGVLLATKEYEDARDGTGPFVVYHVYLFGLPVGDEWKTAPRTEYPDVDALLADGWVVD